MTFASATLTPVSYTHLKIDTYGHDAGDMVLKELAKVFLEVMGKEGKVCRWGGEEFLFVFPVSYTHLSVKFYRQSNQLKQNAQRKQNNSQSNQSLVKRKKNTDQNNRPRQICSKIGNRNNRSSKL